MDRTDTAALTVQQLVAVYKSRPLRDAVIMHLIEVGAFWLKRSRTADSPAEREVAASNVQIVIEAATTLAKKEYWKETNHRDLIVREIESR